MLRLSLAGAAALGALGLAAATTAQPLPTEQYPFTSGPVTITSCSFGASGNTIADNSLEIKYFQNVPRRHLVSVTFRVRYAGKIANVTDTGRFTYDASIDHKFTALTGTPWAGPDPQVCRVLSATFGDGETVRPAFVGPNQQPMTDQGGPPAGPQGGPPGGPPGAGANPPPPPDSGANPPPDSGANPPAPGGSSPP
jgi:hypothetical protein